MDKGSNKYWQELRREARERIKEILAEEDRMSLDLMALALRSVNAAFMEMSVG
jgi:hypothetical protein